MTTTAAPTGPEADEHPTEEDERTWREQLSDAARNRMHNARVRAHIEASRAGTGLKSAVWRNRRQLEPLKITGGTAATGGLGAALAQNPEVSELAAAGGTSVLAGGAAVGAWFWLRQRLAQRWRTRVQLGLGGGAAWAGCAPFVDTLQGGAGMGLALLAGTVGLSARYWQHHRPGYPDPPPTVEDTSDEEPAGEDVGDLLPDIIANWNRHVAAKGGPLEGATIAELGTISTGDSYRVKLVPAKQTLGTAQAKHEAIAGGLRMSPQKVLIEAGAPEDGEDEDPNDLELRVVRSSPITGTVFFERPSYRVNSDGIGFVELGPYADGEGHDAGYALYGPNSMYNGYAAGGTGSGKTKLSETIGLTALSDEAPPTNIVYLDGQSGDSSACLWEHALWRGGPEKARAIAEALLEMMSYRGKYIQWRRRKRGGGGFAPIPSMPGIKVIIDECHAIFEVAGDLFATLARQGRKNGFSIFATSQTVDLPVFGKGGDALRSSLVAGNGIGLRLDSNVQNTVFPGLKADLTKLPAGGYGYTTSGKDVGHRTAQFRTRFLLDQGDAAKLREAGTHVPDTVRLVEDWFAELAPGQHLSDDMGEVAGDAFLLRNVLAEEEDEGLDAIFGGDADPVEAFKESRKGKVKAAAGKPTSRGEDQDGGTVTSLFSGGFGDLGPTAPPAGVPARELKPREQQVVDLLTSYEELSVAQLAEELDISDRAVRNVIRGLESRLTKVRNGVYRLKA